MKNKFTMFKSSSYRNSRMGNTQAVQAKQEEPFFQTKMSIGKPNDKYEMEADSVADKVVQRQDITSIQRLSTPIEDENFSTNDQRIRNDRDIQEKPEVQTKCDHCEQEEASSNVSSMIDNTRGKGQSMPESTRYQMEASFGTSFHDVNIHTDADSVGMNRELGAQAFTHGKDIYFNTGKYNPESNSGQHLLAHELTHVVQQTGGAYRDKIQCDHEKHPQPTTKPAKGKSKEPPAPPPHVKPELSIHSGSMINDGCGELTWDCGWSISQDSSSKGGWVIQEVTTHYNTFDCNMRPILPPGKKNPVHYFEAWRVEPNSTDMTPANIDTFRYIPRPADGTAHSFGVYRAEATAYYHDNVGADELPAHMVTQNPDTFAHALPSSLHDPKLGGDISGPVPHELTYHWSCCGTKGMQPNIIDNQKPS